MLQVSPSAGPVQPWIRAGWTGADLESSVCWADTALTSHTRHGAARMLCKIRALTRGLAFVRVGWAARQARLEADLEWDPLSLQMQAHWCLKGPTCSDPKRVREGDSRPLPAMT